VSEATGRLLSLSAVAGQAAHYSSVTGAFTEQRSGLLSGGNATVAPFSWLKGSADFRTGTLTAVTTANDPTGRGEDMAVTEMEGSLLILPAPWFGFGGGYVKRSEKTDLATQRWEFPKVTAVTRLTFVGGAITAVTGVSLLPGVKYTGYLGKPNPLSFGGDAGLELRAGILSAALMYNVERISFAPQNGITRQDQFSTLRLRLGLQAGR
jgi:hypothetical protein